MTTLTALLALCRPLNCLLTALSTCVGALCVRGGWPSSEVMLAAAAAALVAASGYMANDLMDVQIDRINRPSRPLPAGRLTRTAARNAAWLCAAGALALAAWVGAAAGALVLAVLAALLLYNRRLKRSAPWGNVLVGILGALVFPYGALAAGGLGRAWIPAGFAFLFHLGREIVKDIEDMEGDRALGSRTLALCWGTRKAAGLASAIFLILIGLTLLPWIFGLYGLSYLIPVLLVDAVVLGVLWRLRTLPADSSLSRSLVAGMVLGLAAIVAGEVL